MSAENCLVIYFWRLLRKFFARYTHARTHVGRGSGLGATCARHRSFYCGLKSTAVAGVRFAAPVARGAAWQGRRNRAARLLFSPLFSFRFASLFITATCLLTIHHLLFITFSSSTFYLVFIYLFFLQISFAYIMHHLIIIIHINYG